MTKASARTVITAADRHSPMHWAINYDISMADSTKGPSATRVALVTGANRGLGLETARQLLERGLRVIMAGRDEAAVEEARRSFGAAAQNAIAVRMDVTDLASIQA